MTDSNILHSLEEKIYLIRGKRVMLDRDLAELYGVETRVLNQAVTRNSTRFPDDFMFQLTREEEKFITSRSQIVTLNSKNGLTLPKLLKLKRGSNVKYLPYAFTEQGVAMLSSVLRSKQAIQVNIQIMRTFTKIREMLVSNQELREKIESLESKYDQQFTVVFKAIKQLISPPQDSTKRKIGFETDLLS